MNTAIYSDIISCKDTLRVYNLHLQSIHLNRRNYTYLDSLFISSRENHLSEIKDISHHLKDAYIKRARQVDILSQHIKGSPYPVLVCGDFNDIPVSYTYRKLKGKLKDAFLSSNIGIGATYKRNTQSFRIDYIFHHPRYKSVNFRTDKVNWSDHLPVISELSMRRKK
jgi:endonuclease/exonuclease/phosphatase family metal-dependent hydrolase